MVLVYPNTFKIEIFEFCEFIDVYNLSMDYCCDFDKFINVPTKRLNGVKKKCFLIRSNIKHLLF